MATTLSTDLYQPEVWADLAADAFTGRAIVGGSTAVITDNTLEGNPGDTITFPKWDLLTELADLTEAEALVPEKLTQTSSKGVIKEAGKAVEFTDKALLTGIGNAQDEAIRQFGILAARKVDADLITAATATISGGITHHTDGSTTDSKPLAATATGGLTWVNIVDAIGQFGDDFEPDEFTGLFIRSEQRAQIWKDDQFIAASEIQAGGQGSIVNRGLIGTIAGLPVYVTNRLATNHAVILKQNSLGLFYKRRPLVEQDRDILARTTVVTTNLHYAVKRVSDRGVLDITIA